MVCAEKFSQKWMKKDSKKFARIKIIATFASAIKK